MYSKDDYRAIRCRNLPKLSLTLVKRHSKKLRNTYCKNPQYMLQYTKFESVGLPASSNDYISRNVRNSLDFRRGAVRQHG